MNKVQELFNYIPKQYFVENLKDNRIGHIKLALVRETINPLIIRSTDAEATVTLVTADGRELVEIPPRKLKSREKLLGLMMCREFGVVHESVRYNSIEGAEFLNNPNSVLFGDTSTKAGATAGLSSRAIYDWAYSLRDVKDVTDKLQHNALSEAGTMISETGGMRTSLFNTEYVLPGTFFPHFITVDNVTPELFLHLLFAVLNSKRYGAQTTTNANNMENHLVAIGFASFEKPINSYLISKYWNQAKSDEAPTLESVRTFVVDKMKEQYGDRNLISDNPNGRLADFRNLVSEFWKEENRAELKNIYESAAQSVDSYLKDIKIVRARTEDKDLQALQEAVENLEKEGKEVSEDAVMGKLFEGKKTRRGEKQLRQLFKEHFGQSTDENAESQQLTII